MSPQTARGFRPGAAVAPSVVLSLLICAVHLPAQIAVEITPPRLDDGLAQVEALVAVEVNAAAAEVSGLVNSALQKPGILRGLGNATAAAAAIRPSAAVDEITTYRISVGSAVGVAAETLHWDSMKDRIENLEETDDVYVGVGAQPVLLSFAFPADRLLKSLSFDTGIGYTRSNASEVDVIGFGLSVTARYPVVPRRSLGDYFSHTGLTTSFGTSFLRNEISMVIEPGTVTQTFTLDLDGSRGPLFGQEVSVEVTPEIEAVLESTVRVLSLDVATGIRFLGFLGLDFGATGELTFGESALSLSSDDPIELKGYLSSLIADDGESRLVVSGSTSGISPTPVQYSLWTAATFRVSSYELTVPVAWRSTGGLGGGVFLGVAF